MAMTPHRPWPMAVMTTAPSVAAARARTPSVHLDMVGLPSCGIGSLADRYREVFAAALRKAWEKLAAQSTMRSGGNRLIAESCSRFEILERVRTAKAIPLLLNARYATNRSRRTNASKR